MELNQMFRDCLSIFEKGSFDINGEHYACAIQYEIDALAPHAHNCIACNLAGEIDYIFLFLKSNKERDSKDDVRQYIMYLYIFIEHIETVLGILNIPDIYKNKHFKVFNRIRKWANFFKHPKSFVLTHHPIYIFDSDVESLTDNNSLLINDQFLTNYYSGGVEPEKRKRLNEELFNKMKNNSNVVVCLPNILTLTKSFCYSYKKAIETIVKNQIYLEVLSDETTIQKYFLNLSDF